MTIFQIACLIWGLTTVVQLIATGEHKHETPIVIARGLIFTCGFAATVYGAVAFFVWLALAQF